MKKIIASLAAVATVLSLSVAAFAAAAPGSTNGSADGTATVKADEATDVTLDNGVTVSAPAGAFAAGTDVKVVVDVQKAEPAAVDSAQKTLAAKVESAKINTQIDINVTDKDNKALQPADGKKVTITVAYDGVSNIVAYINDNNTIEWIKLDVSKDKKTASFETSHFSAFYMVQVADDQVNTLLGTTGDPQNPSEDKNQNTGVAIAIIPAAIAAAAVVVSKKRK